MKRLEWQADWPKSWRDSYAYDCEEIWGERRSPGYVYAYENRQKITLELIAEVLSPGARILDVAAAQGNFSLMLAELGYRVTWNDIREELAGYVELKHERGEIAFAPGDAFALSCEKAFDCVLIAEIIEHVAHPDRFLAQAAELVAPGGYVVMTTPNGAYFRNRLPRFTECDDPSQYEAVQFRPNSDGHIFLLWPDELAALARRAGLDVERELRFTTPLTNGHMKLGPLLRVLPKRLVFAVDRAARRLPRSMADRLLVHSAVRCRKPMVK